MMVQVNYKRSSIMTSKVFKWFKSGGGFPNSKEESYFQEQNWKDISLQTRYVLIIGVFVLGLFALLEWSNSTFADEGMIILVAAMPPILISALIIALLKVKNSYSFIPFSLFMLATANALSNAYILVTEFAVWNFYLIIILGQILFFAVFVPNRFKYSLASVAVLVFSYIYLGVVLIGDDILTGQVTLLTLAVSSAALIYKYHLDKRIRQHYEEEKQLERHAQEANFSRDLYEENAAKNIDLMEQLAIAESEAKENSQFLKAVLDHIPQGLIVYDKNYKLVAWNNPFERLLEMPEGFLKVGMSQESILEFNAKRGEYGDGDPDEHVKMKMRQIQASKSRDHFIYDRQRPNGCIMNIIGTSLPDGGIISSYIDVTKEREREEETRLKSLRDSLTDLSNRRAFEADMNSAVRQADKSTKTFVLAVIDLDNFKPVNDTYGHPVGDEVLRSVADIMRSHIRGTDSASRIGGDEFAIVFREVTDLDMIKERVTSIINAIEKITVENCENMTLGASAGIAQYETHGNNVKELIENSDKALYSAKKSGKNTVAISD